MGFFDDWGRSLSRPFQRTVQGFKQVFTDPARANFSDFLSVALPYWGGTIASDIKHPEDIGYQALTLSLAAGGAGLIAPKAATPAAASVFNEAGYATGDLTARQVPTLALSPEPGVYQLASNAWRAPTAAELAAQRGLTIPASSPGVIDAVTTGATSVAKGTANFITKAATLSSAARQIATPWERAAGAVREMVTGERPGPAAGSSTVISAGGAPGTTSPSSSEPIQASAGNWLIIGALVSVAGGLLWSAYKGKKA